MSRTIFTFLVFSISLLAQVTSIPGATGGGGATASGYSAAVSAQTTLTVTAATHGQGTSPVAGCFDNSTPALSVSCSYTRNTSGDVVFTWAPAFTGTVNIWVGAGTSGISGGGNLTTVGAIPYVSASGVLNQDATKLLWDSTNGRLGVGTASPSSTLTIAGITGVTSGGATPPAGIAGLWFNYTGNTSTIQSVASGSSGKALVISGYPLSFQDSQSGTESARFAITSQNLLIGGTTDGNYKLDVQKSGSTGTLRVYDQTATTGSTLAVIQAGAGQSGNLLSVRNNAGAELAYANSGGGFAATGVYTINGVIGSTGSGVFNFVSDGVIRMTNNATTDFNRLQFGGTTSSFPALKRSSAILQARLADDSAMTDVQVSSIITKQTTPSASTDACTAGAIWADATYIYACTASGTIKRATLATF